MRPEPAAIGNMLGREDAIEANRCLACNTQLTVDQISMWPMATQREYQISGVCRKCQAVVFDEDLTVCTCDSPCCSADVGIGVIDCGSQHCPVHGTAGGAS
jgi:hypothetical protein